MKIRIDNNFAENAYDANFENENVSDDKIFPKELLKIFDFCKSEQLVNLSMT